MCTRFYMFIVSFLHKTAPHNNDDDDDDTFDYSYGIITILLAVLRRAMLV